MEDALTALAGGITLLVIQAMWRYLPRTCGSRTAAMLFIILIISVALAILRIGIHYVIN